jgi:DNA-binding NarL/FixJ family response regulator
MSMVRVLIVDDSPAWLDLVRSQLELDPNVRVVGTAATGFAAVRKVEELRPDLILLDVGLPGMDGIETAREIRSVSPRAAILFVSCESDPDVVQAALRAGGNGYIHKFAAAKELRAGMEAVLLGLPFLSRGLLDLENQS